MSVDGGEVVSDDVVLCCLMDGDGIGTVDG